MIESLFVWMEELYSALAAVSHISLWVYVLVTTGGVASAISPCYVPVLTMFGGYVGGFAQRRKTSGLTLALPFILGNAVSLAAVGAVASLVGASTLGIFRGYELDRWIPGGIGLLMGLQILGLVQLKMPTMPIFRWSREPSSRPGAFALGLPFGLVVTPCTMPIFFAIVTFVAFQATIVHGALLMIAYALGRGLILSAVALSVGLLKTLNIARTSHYFERVSGTVILVASIGLLLFYDAFVRITGQWMVMGQ